MSVTIDYQWPIVGQEKAQKYLKTSIGNRSLSHAYVFFGPEKVGKVHMAKLFAKSILCENYRKYAANVLANGESKLPCGECETCRQVNKGVFADLYFVEREKRKLGTSLKTEISVEQIRDLLERISKRSFHNSYKIVIIPEAEALNNEASNALLKTLEEPTERTIIILIAPAREFLLPTILSRAQSVKFSLAPKKAIADYLLAQGAGRDEAHDLANVCAGRPTVAMQLYHDPEDYAARRAAAQDWLRVLSADLPERFAFAERLTDKTSADAVKSELSRAALLLRDLLLVNLGMEDLLVNAFMRREIVAAARDFSPVVLLRRLEQANVARDYLGRNVNARLVMENFLI